MNTFGKFVVGLLVLGSFGIWGYAYSGQADRVTPDTLDDPLFAQRAEAVCAETMVRFDALPNAEDAADNRERADQIRARDAVLYDMIARLERFVGGSDRDVEMSTEWLGDWTTYVDEREDYANRFELDESEVLYVSAEGGERLERRITRFANTNRMPSCATPLDVG